MNGGREPNPSDPEKELADLLYIISHDFNAPLRHINGFAKILKSKNESILDETSIEYLDIIINAGEQLTQMLNGMLSLSRVTTRTSEFETVKLDSLVREVAQQKQHSNECNNNYSIEIDDLPSIECDVVQLKGAIDAILDNAIKNSKKDQLNNISVRQLECDNGIIIEFQDEGTGVNEKLQNEIFKPLRRGVSKDDYPGTGIGLPFAKRVLERHDATITLAESTAEGSKFHIKFTK